MPIPARPSPHPRCAARAFSLIELVLVVAIMGVVAMIAVPRMSSAAERSKAAAVIANLRVLDTAVEMYTVEHEGLSPALESNGSPTDGESLVKRLTDRSSLDGSGPAIYGPYLRALPVNPYNGRADVRVDGDPAGIDKTGWRYDTARRRFQADDPKGAGMKIVSAVVRGDSVESSEDLGELEAAPLGK